jgi:hypothetical protein
MANFTNPSHQSVELIARQRLNKPVQGKVKHFSMNVFFNNNAKMFHVFIFSFQFSFFNSALRNTGRRDQAQFADLVHPAVLCKTHRFGRDTNGQAMAVSS